MRVRLFGVVLTILTAGLLLATPAAAQPPSKLTDHITDGSGVLTDSGRAAVSSAIDRLYRDRHIQLWVAYVDNLNRFKPENWVANTRSESGMNDSDVLLVVATNTKTSKLDVPPKAAQDFTPAELNSLQSNKIDPLVSARDWSGAAVAAADGLDKQATSPSSPSSPKSSSSSNRLWLLIAIGVIVAVVILVVVLLLFGRRRRRAGRRVDPAGGPVNIDSLSQALSTADDRLRQITDYVARHSESIGAEARSRLDEAKRHLAAAHGKEASDETEAIAHANRASTLAAEAQTRANSDVLAAHRTPRRRGTAAKR
jgi:uncharacterized membrane protein YgcG